MEKKFFALAAVLGLISVMCIVSGCIHPYNFKLKSLTLIEDNGNYLLEVKADTATDVKVYLEGPSRESLDMVVMSKENDDVRLLITRGKKPSGSYRIIVLDKATTATITVRDFDLQNGEIILKEKDIIQKILEFI